jgi:hypothetical protein
MKRDLSYVDEIVVARVHAEMINAGIIPTFNDLTTVEEYGKNTSKDDIKKRKRKFRKIKKKLLKRNKFAVKQHARILVENYFLEKALNDYDKNKRGVIK